MLLVGNTSKGVWGERMGACGLLVYGCGMSTKGGQSSAISFGILPSEEWDGASSRLLMAVFMNNGNFIIIKKV